MHHARVHVHVIVLVVDVVCLMLVFSALVVLHAVFVSFLQPVFYSKMCTLYTPVGDSKLRWLLPNFVTVTFAPNSF